MSLNREVKSFGMPWEEQYGYAQAVRVDNTIYVSGQLSHDEHGSIVGPAPLDSMGKIVDTRTWKHRCARPMPTPKRFFICSELP